MRKIFVLLALFIFLPLPALAKDIACPELKIDQAVARLPQGWISSTLTTNIPQSDILTVFDGPPGEMASLVPDNEPLQEGEQHFWTFSGDKTRPIWVQCAYKGQATHLSSPLPEGNHEMHLNGAAYPGL